MNLKTFRGACDLRTLSSAGTSSNTPKLQISDFATVYGRVPVVLNIGITDVITAGSETRTCTCRHIVDHIDNEVDTWKHFALSVQTASTACSNSNTYKTQTCRIGKCRVLDHKLLRSLVADRRRRSKTC